MNQITCVLLYFNNHITNSRNSQTSEVKWASLLFSSFLALILQLVKISNWSGNSWKSISLMSASEEIHTTACWPTVFWILIAHCCYSCCPAPLGKQLPLCAQHLKRHIPSTQLLCVTRFCWRFVFTRSLSEDTIQNWNFYHICIYIYIHLLLVDTGNFPQGREWCSFPTMTSPSLSLPKPSFSKFLFSLVEHPETVLWNPLLGNPDSY